MGEQLSLKAAMPLAEILATCRKNVSNTGPWILWWHLIWHRTGITISNFKTKSGIPLLPSGHLSLTLRVYISSASFIWYRSGSLSLKVGGTFTMKIPILTKNGIFILNQSPGEGPAYVRDGHLPATAWTPNNAILLTGRVLISTLNVIILSVPGYPWFRILL